MLSDAHSYFTDDELSELKKIYLAACRELGIDLSASHGPLRERVASLIMEFARAGERDSDTIRMRAIGALNVPGNHTHAPPQSIF
jgi:hypothetical protein